MAEPLPNDRFPLSSKYDRDWLLRNQMGPNALWLMEWLCADMDLKPGMRVLDMGCGMAMSSIFLAREYGVQVWANDLWISATDNWKRIQEQNLEDRICPIRAEANALPYAKNFFDAIVTVDAFHYFGLEDGYVDKFLRFVRPGGKIGIAVPGRTVEIGDDEAPEYLREWLKLQEGAFETWQSAEYWRRHLAKSAELDVQLADTMEDGWREWISFGELTIAAGQVKPEGFEELARKEVDSIREDAGRTMGFVRAIATRRA